jgi:hypothetical protein
MKSYVGKTYSRSETPCQAGILAWFLSLLE